MFSCGSASQILDSLSTPQSTLVSSSCVRRDVAPTISRIDKKIKIINCLQFHIGVWVRVHRWCISFVKSVNKVDDDLLGKSSRCCFLSHSFTEVTGYDGFNVFSILCSHLYIWWARYLLEVEELCSGTSWSTRVIALQFAWPSCTLISFLKHWHGFVGLV